MDINTNAYTGYEKEGHSQRHYCLIFRDVIQVAASIMICVLITYIFFYFKTWDETRIMLDNLSSDIEERRPRMIRALDGFLEAVEVVTNDPQRMQAVLNNINSTLERMAGEDVDVILDNVKNATIIANDILEKFQREGVVSIQI